MPFAAVALSSLFYLDLLICLCYNSFISKKLYKSEDVEVNNKNNEYKIYKISEASERIDEAALESFKYYGIDFIEVVKH